MASPSAGMVTTTSYVSAMPMNKRLHVNRLHSHARLRQRSCSGPAALVMWKYVDRRCVHDAHEHPLAGLGVVEARFVHTVDEEVVVRRRPRCPSRGMRTGARAAKYSPQLPRRQAPTIDCALPFLIAYQSEPRSRVRMTSSGPRPSSRTRPCHELAVDPELRVQCGEPSARLDRRSRRRSPACSCKLVCEWYQYVPLCRSVELERVLAPGRNALRSSGTALRPWRWARAAHASGSTSPRPRAGS
jgi:hypothetical protein